jgi:hypothetical protein
MVNVWPFWYSIHESLIFGFIVWFKSSPKLLNPCHKNIQKPLVSLDPSNRNIHLHGQITQTFCYAKYIQKSRLLSDYSYWNIPMTRSKTGDFLEYSILWLMANGNISDFFLDSNRCGIKRNVAWCEKE